MLSIPHHGSAVLMMYHERTPCLSNTVVTSNDGISSSTDTRWMYRMYMKAGMQVVERFTVVVG